MSLVTTPTLMRGESSRLRQSTSAVLPLPTGPATPTRNARMDTRLEQEISLGQRQHAGGLAGEQLAIGADLVGFGIDFEFGHGRIVNHVALAGTAAVLHRYGVLWAAALLWLTRFRGSLLNKNQARAKAGR